MSGSIIRAIAALQTGHDPYRPGSHHRHEEPNDDAELIELGVRWVKANAEFHAACERESVIEEAVKHPEPPEALLVQDGDETFPFARFAVIRGDGRRWYLLGSLREPAEQGLRRIQRRAHCRPVRPQDNLPADAATVTESVPWPEAQARADAIVRAWDTWQAEIEAAEIEAGLPGAKAQAQRLSAVVSDLQERIEVATAHTLAGLKVKARYARHLDDEGSMIPEGLASGILRDLLALDC